MKSKSVSRKVGEIIVGVQNPSPKRKQAKNKNSIINQQRNKFHRLWNYFHGVEENQPGIMNEWIERRDDYFFPLKLFNDCREKDV